MTSVTNRLKNIKQPYGGYLPVSMFKTIQLDNSHSLHENENIYASLVGTAVDYLTRYFLGGNAMEAFSISLKGAKLIEKENIAKFLINEIKGLDDKSIVAACKLAGFDVCYRSSIKDYKPIEEINPDDNTIENIRIMVNRSLSFFKEYGPVICFNLNFEGGYTDTVSKGDGDFLTQDTLWDFKVSNSKITSKNTLQILMYYVLGIHSEYDYYKNVKSLGFYNPRMNIVYLCSVADINNEIIKKIEDDVICYESNFIKINEKNYEDIELTVAEIEKFYGYSKSSIYKAIREEKVFAYKKKNKYYINKIDFEEYIEKMKKEIKKRTALICTVYLILFVIILFFLLIHL